jgi:hypothetical protein
MENPESGAGHNSIPAVTGNSSTATSGPPKDAQPPLSISGRIFATLEHAWFQRVVGMVAVFFALFDGRYISIVSLMLPLAIHRAKSLRGVARGKQAVIYMTTFCVLFATLWAGGKQWNRSRDNSPLIKAITDAVRRAVSGTVSTSQTIYVPPPPVKPTPAPAPTCAEDQSRPYKCMTGKNLGLMMIEESETIGDQTDKTITSIRNHQSAARDQMDNEAVQARAEAAFYASDARQLGWIKDISAMRAEALYRLDGPGKNIDEFRGWEELRPVFPGDQLSPWKVQAYLPYLAKLGEKLKQSGR